MNKKQIELFKPEFIKNYDTFLFDCDGVLYYGDNPMKSAVNAVNTLKQAGKDIFFIVFLKLLLYSQIIIH